MEHDFLPSAGLAVLSILLHILASILSTEICVYCMGSRDLVVGRVATLLSPVIMQTTLCTCTCGVCYTTCLNAIWVFAN